MFIQRLFVHLLNPPVFKIISTLVILLIHPVGKAPFILNVDA